MSHRTGDIDNEVADILASLPKHHDGNFGFVIYRCTYDDDEKWNQFRRKLQGFVDVRIARRVGGETLKHRFAWDVREDSSLYKDATTSEVRG